jgi:hypothetical protein
MANGQITRLSDSEILKAKLLEYLARKHPPQAPRRNQPPVDNSETINTVTGAIIRGTSSSAPSNPGHSGERALINAVLGKQAIEFPQGWTEKDAQAMAETCYHLFQVAQEYKVDAADTVMHYVIVHMEHFKEGPEKIAEQFNEMELQDEGGKRIMLTGGIMLREAKERMLGKTQTWVK